MLKRTLCLLLMSALMLSFVPLSPVTSALPGPADYWTDYAAPGFEAGNGSASNPYVIKSAEQLALLAAELGTGSSFTGKYIVLGADIDLSGHIWQPPQQGFSGSFDGRFYSIEGMHIHASEHYVGLFGLLNSGSTVKNLYLDGDISVKQVSNTIFDIGSVAGYSEGSIQNCSYTGTISVDNSVHTGFSVIGGIVGFQYSRSLEGCVNNAAITVNLPLGSECYVGGIAGVANVSILNCANTGDITVSNWSYTHAGGIAGIAYYDVNNIYNTGNISLEVIANATAFCGGLIGGIFYAGASITNGYQAGTLYASSPVQANCGFIAGDRAGISGGSYTYENIYYNSTLSAQYVISGASQPVTLVTGNYGPITDTAMPMSTADMTSANPSSSLYALLNAAAELSYLNYGVYGTENHGYPSFITFAGTGAYDDPYIIDSAARLLYFSQNVSAGNSYAYKHFAVVRDIDLCGSDNVLWTPVGFAPNPRPFSGFFDGRGHDITGMKLDYVTGSSTVMAGLFCWLNRESGFPGVIKNLNVTGDIDASCTNNISPTIGGIAAHSNGNIINCTYSGTIDASAERDFLCGGIAGYLHGTIDGCSSDAAINATVSAGFNKAVMATGGIVGYAVMSDILNTFYAGTVTLNFNDCYHADSAVFVGGIAGRLLYSTIKNCYARSQKTVVCSNITNANEAAGGGMAGIASESEIENCICYNDVSFLSNGSPQSFGSICGKYENVTISFCLYYIYLNGSGGNTDPAYVISGNYKPSGLSSGITVGSGSYHTAVDVLNAWTCAEDPEGLVYYGWAQIDGSPAGNVVFGPRAYPVDADTADNGSISAYVYFAFPGESVGITTAPDMGYAVKTQYFNGTAFTGAAFTMPSEPVTLSAEFELLDMRYGLTHKYCTVNPDETETLDGTVSEGTEYPGHTGKFLSGKYGGVLTNALLKNESYGGEAYALFSATPSDGYTLYNDFSQSFELVYKRYTYAITLAPCENGLVEVSGGPIGLAGSSKTVTITPDTGYTVADVLVDGVSVGKVLTYSFEGLAQNHTVEVTFELLDMRYGLTHKYCTVNPDGTETLDGTLIEGAEYSGHTGRFLSGKYGDVLTNALLKNESYGGAAYGLFSAAPSDGYTLYNDFSQSFELVYKRYAYGITLAPCENGDVEVSGGPTGLAGSSKTVTITPDTGYAVADVLVDGVSVGKVLTYSFEGLAQNHTVEVTFELEPNPNTGVEPTSRPLPAALALLCANALALLPLYKKLKARP